MLVAIMLNHEQGTELQMNSCDTNQDGVVDIEDIVLLFEWILDLDMNSRKFLVGNIIYWTKVYYFIRWGYWRVSDHLFR